MTLATLAPTAGLALLVAGTAEPNYDEAKVPRYVLPGPLVMQDGTRVTGAGQWPARRAEILDLFRGNVYGHTPAPRDPLECDVRTEKGVLGGLATRKQIALYAGGRHSGVVLNLLLYVPSAADGPVPAFLGLNFPGNHTVADDDGIDLPACWVPDDPGMGVAGNRAREENRGEHAAHWQVDRLLRGGYALATMCYCDIDPDYDDGFRNGVHPLFYREGQTAPDADQWGSIAAWAWGLSRALDYLVSDPDVDGSRVAVVGHSRLGKTALWAAAEDERFAMAISNDSGCGGAALSRRAFGETVARINTVFPHWFCGDFHQYNDREAELPVDQHELIALIAPRPVYVASAEDDLWADPRGEFLAAKHADPVYRLLGTDGLPCEEMPPVNQPVFGTIGYHIRTGGHGILEYDWLQYTAFADRHLRR